MKPANPEGPIDPPPARHPQPAARPSAAGARPPEEPHAPTFETSLAELNELVARLESGGLGLSDSIQAYERGVSLLRQLHEQLADVEERVRLLVRIDAEGRPVLEPIGTESAGREKPVRGATAEGSAQEPDGTAARPTRSTARTGRAKRLPGMEDGDDARASGAG